jgi:two-component system OmpR family response regulator
MALPPITPHNVICISANPHMRLLIIEDDKELRTALQTLLTQKGYLVDAIESGREGLRLLLAQDYELAIVDLALPEMDGLSLIRALRKHQRGLPILIITARDAVDDRVAGLDAGADDYLVKPFEMQELEARARALIRRSRADRAQAIRLGPLELTMGQPRILLSGVAVDLTAREFALLELLALRAGRVVNKDLIASRLARSGEALSDTAIEVAVHRLRRRLEPYSLHVRTVRGFGYLLETSEEHEADG